MQIRCGTCHGSIWIQASEAHDDWGVVSCHGCSQEYDLRSTLESRDLDDLRDDAREFAQTAGIDLPASYSVLLGIMTLGKVRDLCGRMSSSNAPARFDPSFKAAVESGRLTPQQSAMRGKREVFARSLVDRHGISMEQAARVADNEIPLLEAVRAGAPIERVEISFQSSRRPWLRMATWVGGLAAILVAAAVIVWSRGDDPPASVVERQVSSKPARVIASLDEVKTELRYDVRGKVTEITGGNPEAILRAFCQSVDGFAAEPVTLEATGDAWTGLYRQRGALYGITIRRDPQRDLWVAGNGVDGIRGEAIVER
jgi:hypothetical protein